MIIGKHQVSPAEVRTSPLKISTFITDMLGGALAVSRFRLAKIYLPQACNAEQPLLLMILEEDHELSSYRDPVG